MDKLPRMARVFWLDALHYPDFEKIEWLREQAKPSELCSVGHILKADKKVILIAQELKLEKGMARDTTVIRRADVVKIEWLSTSSQDCSQEL
mgnify:CR=1 FL=1